MPRKGSVWAEDPQIDAFRRTKPRIAAACETFIVTELKPRFLPTVTPSDEFNYPVDIVGGWHGNAYRFMVRYRCGGENRTADGFDAPFARLEGKAPDLFDISWHRHTGKWHPMFADVTLAEASDLMLSVPTLQPVC